MSSNEIYYWLTNERILNVHFCSKSITFYTIPLKQYTELFQNSTKKRLSFNKTVNYIIFFDLFFNSQRLLYLADEGSTGTSIIQRTVVLNATGDNLISAVEGGYKSLKSKEELEKNFPTIDDGTPSYRHQQVMKSGPESIRIARNGYVENIATEKLRSVLRCSWITP